MLAQLLRADLLPEAWIAAETPGSSACWRGTGPSLARLSTGRGSTGWPPITAMTAVRATGPGWAVAGRAGAADVVLCYPPDRLARKFAYQTLVEEFAVAGRGWSWSTAPTATARKTSC